MMRFNDRVYDANLCILFKFKFTVMIHGHFLRINLNVVGYCYGLWLKFKVKVFGEDMILSYLLILSFKVMV
jgi:hypothetical protein